MLALIKHIDTRQALLRVGGHRPQHPGQTGDQAFSSGTRERLPCARRAEGEIVTGADEEKSEMSHRTVICEGRRHLERAELQRKARRDEVDGYPTRYLPEGAEPSALEGTHREPLMV